MHVCAECGERSDAPGICSRDSQPLVAADDPLIGTDIGRYRIARAIAAGGMGRVYLGVHPEIGSRVAIKILSEQCAHDAELVERFFAEARAVNLIQHENIVNVLDLAMLDDGRPFIVMEHVDGITLTQATRGGRAPLGGIVHVFLDVLAALAAAHAIGIVHRDLKPDNIMVTAKGHARVLDFGIAKLSPQQQQFAGVRTVTGALLGTPAYMAPEQIASAGNVDARSDVYAVGAVLFHAVTGRPPFGGATMFDIMRAQLEEDPPSPRAFRPDLPLVLERVIMRALAKDPAVRFPSATEMAAALDEAAADLPDHQWFDLSRRTAPMRARGSGKLTRPPLVQRDTPPAMSAVNVPVAKQPRRRAALPIAFSAAALALAGGLWLVLARSPAQPPAPDAAKVASLAAAPDARPLVETPIDAAILDAANDAPPARPADTSAAGSAVARPDTSAAGSAVARPIPRDLRPAPSPRDPKLAPLAEVPTKAKPLVVPIDLGAAKQHMTLEATLPHAHAVARMLPGVKQSKLVSIRFAGDGLDATRGGWVRYKLNVDPPLDAGCDVWVTFGARTTVYVQKGTCNSDELPLPKCSFEEAWNGVRAIRGKTKAPLEYIEKDGPGFWDVSDNHESFPDRCR